MTVSSVSTMAVVMDVALMSIGSTSVGHGSSPRTHQQAKSSLELPTMARSTPCGTIGKTACLKRLHVQQETARRILRLCSCGIIYIGAVQSACEGLGLEPSSVPELVRKGAIIGWCERHRRGSLPAQLFDAGRRLRFIVDAVGRILRRSSIDYGDGVPPRVLHRLSQ
ncbi:DUF6522 family protein [Microvirga guangxiensis]|uniref:DUF6522 family protein n=1 Tax=Microvirga guangxiensis TaxID=549386 RepID=UPI003CC7A38D